MEMDLDLYPSEIARLVLGYQQEQNCDEAAKVFLETSPDLGEHRTVTKRNGTYGKKCNYKYLCKLSLLDILHEYCEISKLVLGKISEGQDYEELKNKKLSEQIKYLLEGPRFVVNINVPSQNSPSSSKISNRKRNHSLNEPGKAVKSLNNSVKSFQKESDKIQKSFENLSAHQTSTPTKLSDAECIVNNVNNRLCTDLNAAAHSLSKTGSPNKVGPSSTENNVNLETPSVSSSNNFRVDKAVETIQSKDVELNKEKSTVATSVEKNSTATSTEQLMNYCSTEVQTQPFNSLDWEPDVVDEPVQGLNLITQELLNREELQERIAENINKSIQSALASRKDTNSSEDFNIVSLLEADAAADSIANNEPLFNSLLNEIFLVETPGYSDSNNQPCPQLDEQIEFNEDKNVDNLSELTEIENEQQATVPLKHRLRGSSKFPIPDEEKEILLENQNAEAIRNIVNVISGNKNLKTNEQPLVPNPPVEITPQYLNNAPSHTEEVEVENTSNQIESISTEAECNFKKPRKAQQKNKTATEETKKKKKRMPKPKQAIISENPDSDVKTVPTLILCPEQNYPISSSLTDSSSTSTPPMSSLYLKTVEVPVHLLTTGQKTLHQSVLTPQKQAAMFSPQQMIISPRNSNHQVILSTPLNEPIRLPVNSSNSSSGVDSVITLYSSETSAETRVAPIVDLPIVLEDGFTTYNFTGTGLSPFFKQTGQVNVFENNYIDIHQEPLRVQQVNSNEQKEETTNDASADASKPAIDLNEKLSDSEPPSQLFVENIQNNEDPTEVIENNQDETNLNRSRAADAITKNTPRSLLLARSQSGRISCSTPRRKTNHVRALFNTPMKLTSDTVMDHLQKAKSVCRGSLFKSPPFSGEVPPLKLDTILEENQAVNAADRIKVLSPIKSSTHLEVPVVTRCPTPKLQGNWSKVSGMGLILGENSTSGESSSEKLQTATCPTKLEKSVEIKRVAKKSWDEDLRKIVGTTCEEASSKNTKPPKKKRKKSVSTVDTEPAENEVSEKSTRGRKRKLHNDMNKNKDEKKVDENEEQPAKKKKQTKAQKLNAEDNLQFEITCEENKVDDDAKKENENEDKPSETKVQTRARKLSANKKPPAKLTQKPPEQQKTRGNKKKMNEMIPFDVIPLGGPKTKNNQKKTNETTTPAAIPFEESKTKNTIKKTNEVTLPLPSEESKTDKANEITPPGSAPVSKRKQTKSSEKKKHKSPVTLNLKIDGPSMSNLDLETPQKTESELTLPATPQVLYTPADSLIKSLRSKSYSDKSIKCGIDTPCLDYPPKTPSIVMTPKIIEEDNDKKSSPYYEPSEEPKSKEVIESQKIIVQETTTITIQKNRVELSENKAVEITRYGVVENKPLTSESNAQNEKTELMEVEEEEEEDDDDYEVPDNMNTSVNSATDSDNESNTSSSSSSSSSSSNSSSSSSNSSSSSSSNTSSSSSPMKSVNEVEESHPVQEDHETEESEMEIRLQQDSSHDERDYDEGSPKKVYPDPSVEAIKETPAKDENSAEQTSMSETPIASDAERTALRLQTSMNNLTSEIKAMIKPSEIDLAPEKAEFESTELQKTDRSVSPSLSKKQNVIKKPKIIDVKKIEPSAQLMQSLKLKETANRVLASLKDQGSNQNVNIKQKKGTLVKKNPEVKKSVPLATENLKSKSKIEENDKEEKNESNRGKVRTSPRKTVKQKDQSDVETKLAKMFSESTKEVAKAIAVIPVVPENSKAILKAKVDQVKRDLFSDEEINDQRTTRSKSARQTIENKKVEDNLFENKVQEKVPVVLECLELMPANKSNSEIITSDLEKTSEGKKLNEALVLPKTCNVHDISINFDESTVIEDRELESFPDSEITIYYQNQGLPSVERSNLFCLFELPCSLVSPNKATALTNQKVHTVKRTPIKKRDRASDKEVDSITEVQSDKRSKTKKSKSSHSEKSKKSSKKKLPSSKENAEDKNKLKSDPQKLFKNIQIDEFLKSLHDSDS